MQLSKWQMSTLVLGAMWLGAMWAPPGFPTRVEAAPSDVLGSPNVAVTGFKNNSGAFTLWSDGHITTVPGDTTTHVSQVTADVKTSGSYTPAPPNLKSVAVTGRPNGSPNVAVGVAPTEGATYVLFADGSLQQPVGVAGTGAGTSYPASGTLTNTSPASYHTEGCKITSFPYNSGTPVNGCHVVLDHPGTKPPIVVATLLSGSGFLSLEHVTNDSFDINVSWAASPTPNAGYCFIVTTQ